MVAASAAAFGWIFATRYRTSRSLLTVSVEHGLVGLGQYFFHGAVET